MERRSVYPIEIKAKVDLNTELLLGELANKLQKSRSHIIRLIITQFIDNNEAILDDTLDPNVDKQVIIDNILKDFSDATRQEIKEFRKWKKEQEKIKQI